MNPKNMIKPLAIAIVTIGVGLNALADAVSPTNPDFVTSPSVPKLQATQAVVDEQINFEDNNLLVLRKLAVDTEGNVNLIGVVSGGLYFYANSPQIISGDALTKIATAAKQSGSISPVVLGSNIKLADDDMTKRFLETYPGRITVTKEAEPSTFQYTAQYSSNWAADIANRAELEKLETGLFHSQITKRYAYIAALAPNMASLVDWMGINKIHTYQFGARIEGPINEAQAGSLAKLFSMTDKLSYEFTSPLGLIEKQAFSRALQRIVEQRGDIYTSLFSIRGVGDYSGMYSTFAEVKNGKPFTLIGDFNASKMNWSTGQFTNATVISTTKPSKELLDAVKGGQIRQMYMPYDFATANVLTNDNKLSFIYQRIADKKGMMVSSDQGLVLSRVNNLKTEEQQGSTTHSINSNDDLSLLLAKAKPGDSFTKATPEQVAKVYETKASLPPFMIYRNNEGIILMRINDKPNDFNETALLRH